jgi:hypothetical protein
LPKQPIVGDEPLSVRAAQAHLLGAVLQIQFTGEDQVKPILAWLTKKAVIARSRFDPHFPTFGKRNIQASVNAIVTDVAWLIAVRAGDRLSFHLHGEGVFQGDLQSLRNAPQGFRGVVWQTVVAGIRHELVRGLSHGASRARFTIEGVGSLFQVGGNSTS